TGCITLNLQTVCVAQDLNWSLTVGSDEKRTQGGFGPEAVRQQERTALAGDSPHVAFEGVQEITTTSPDEEMRLQFRRLQTKAATFALQSVCIQKELAVGRACNRQEHSRDPLGSRRRSSRRL